MLIDIIASTHIPRSALIKSEFWKNKTYQESVKNVIIGVLATAQDSNGAPSSTNDASDANDGDQTDEVSDTSEGRHADEDSDMYEVSDADEARDAEDPNDTDEGRHADEDSDMYDVSDADEARAAKDPNDATQASSNERNEAEPCQQAHVAKQQALVAEEQDKQLTELKDNLKALQARVVANMQAPRAETDASLLAPPCMGRGLTDSEMHALLKRLEDDLELLQVNMFRGSWANQGEQQVFSWQCAVRQCDLEYRALLAGK